MLLTAMLVLSMRYTGLMPLAQLDYSIYDSSLSLAAKRSLIADQINIVSLTPSDFESKPSSLATKEAVITLLSQLEQAQSIVILPADALQAKTQTLQGFEALSSYVQTLDAPADQKEQLQTLLLPAQQQATVDDRLLQAIKAHPVFLPTTALPNSAAPADNNLMTNILATFAAPQGLPIFDSAQMLQDDLAKVATGLGTSIWLRDQDGLVRSLPLFDETGQEKILSLPLRVAMFAQQGKLDTNHQWAVDQGNRVYPSFYAPAVSGQPVFKTFSYSQLRDGNMAAEQFKQKIVIIHITNQTDITPISVPTGVVNGQAELFTHALASLIGDDMYVHNQKLVSFELTLFVLVALFLMLVLPRFGMALGSFLSFVVLLSLIGLQMYLLLGKHIWLQSGLAIVLLATGYLIILIRFVFALQQRQHDAEIFETNRQLGLMLQDQGKLEQAFVCFQRLHNAPQHLELVYNLALDFERKRKFNNAKAAFAYILQHQHDFKDAAYRLQQSEHMQKSLTSGTGQFNTLGTLLSDGNGEKPMLGRFVIEKELGRGAMGAVYLGRDPKIDRVVAVKTLALAEEFASDELAEVEQRFFHEATAAGRLNHPNIVTIYDAAEDHDLAYIAMEYIQGQSLDSFVSKSKLLPVSTVLQICAKIADALEYAGNQGIVHRDIKPANIMFDPSNNMVKITDFGIARISSSGRTKTGMILGTPSYMSPEQMSGLPVDFRSDIFSLGITLFVLLTGTKPFTGDSLASMSYQIVNGKHPDILTLRADLPKSIKTIIDKALQKNPDNRYKSGIIMKRAIIRCLKSIEEETKS